MAPRVRPRGFGETTANAAMSAREPAWRRVRMTPLRPATIEPAASVAMAAPDVVPAGRVAERAAVAPSARVAAWLVSLFAHGAFAAVVLISAAPPEESKGEPAIAVTLVSEDAPVGAAAADARAAPPPDVALAQTPPEIPAGEIEPAMPDVDVPPPEPAPPVAAVVPPAPAAEVDVPLPESAAAVAAAVPEVDVALPAPVPPLAPVVPPQPAAEIDVPLPEPVAPVAFAAPAEPIPAAETAAAVDSSRPEPVPSPMPPAAATARAEPPPPPRFAAPVAPRPTPARPVAKAAPPPTAPVAAKPAAPKTAAAKAAAAIPADGENRADRTRGQAATGGANGASNAAMSSWRAAVQAAILRRKPAPDDAREGLVRVGFSVGRSGDLAGVRVAASSGVAALDAAALAAVRRAAPFPPVPPGLTAPVAMEVPVRFQIQ